MAERFTNTRVHVVRKLNQAGFQVGIKRRGRGIVAHVSVIRHTEFAVELGPGYAVVAPVHKPPSQLPVSGTHLHPKLQPGIVPTAQVNGRRFNAVQDVISRPGRYVIAVAVHIQTISAPGMVIRRYGRVYRKPVVTGELAGKMRPVLVQLPIVLQLSKNNVVWAEAENVHAASKKGTVKV